MILYVSSPTLELCLWSTPFEFRSILRDRRAVSYKHGRKSSQGLLLSDWAEKHKRFLAPVEARTAATVWNRSGKTMFPGAHAWKLLSRLFFRPNWLPLGLRGWFHCGIRLHLLCTAVPSPQTKSGRGTSVSYRLSPDFLFRGGAAVHRLLQWLAVILFSLKFDKLLTTERGLHRSWRLMQNVVEWTKRPLHVFFSL